MSAIKYSLEPAEPSQRLTVTAPTAVIDAALKHLGDKQKLGSRADNGDESSWGINAVMLGRLKGHQGKTMREDYLARINRVISSVSRSSASSDAALGLKMYRPLQHDYFDIEVDIQRPQVEAATVKRLGTAAMAQMAVDLGHQLPQGFPRVDYEEEYVGLTLSRVSSLRTLDDISARRQEQPNLIGNNVRDGAEPLIYLAGAVAIARADEA